MDVLKWVFKRSCVGFPQRIGRICVKLWERESKHRDTLVNLHSRCIWLSVSPLETALCQPKGGLSISSVWSAKGCSVVFSVSSPCFAVCYNPHAMENLTGQHGHNMRVTVAFQNVKRLYARVLCLTYATSILREMQRGFRVINQANNQWAKAHSFTQSYAITLPGVG